MIKEKLCSHIATLLLTRSGAATLKRDDLAALTQGERICQPAGQPFSSRAIQRRPLKRADDALYVAKKSGRNRITLRCYARLFKGRV
jgi:hypothetical protein